MRKKHKILVRSIRILFYAAIFCTTFAWLFSGVLTIGNFPPKPQIAQAVPVSAFASSNSADGSYTGWTNPTYAYNDDGSQFATRAGSSKNAWYGTLYGFNLSAIPDGAIINSVTITAEWKNSANDANGPEFFVSAKSGGAEVGAGTLDGSGQTTFELVNYSPAGLTAADLKATGANGFWAIVRFRRTDNTAHTASMDYVKVAVDYSTLSAPTVTTQDASSVEDVTAVCNGTITATGGENATAAGCEWDTDSGAPYTNSTSTPGSFGAVSFTQALESLPTGTRVYVRAFATNSAGTGYGNEVNFLTKPAAPANVAAADGAAADKVAVTWTKSTGATGYRVYRDGVDVSGLLGDVAAYDDTGADAPTLTPGTASATDGSATDKITLSITGASANNGTTHTYKVVAANATGNSIDSATNDGYRGVGALTYQWKRSAADSDASYSDLAGATTASYDDATAPAPTITAGTAAATDGTFTDHVVLSISGASANAGEGRYFYATVSAMGAAPQDTNHDRGNVGVGSLTYQWQRSAADSDASYSDIAGATTATHNDTAAPAPSVTPGTASATDGAATDKVTLTVTGASANAGAARYFKAVLNAAGAAQQTTAANRGYRGVGALSYQWYRSGGDSDASYSSLDGATTASYDDATAPAPTITIGTVTASDGTSEIFVTLTLNGQAANAGEVRYFYATVSAMGAAPQDTNHDRGFRNVGSLTYQWQRSAGDSDASYSDISGATTNPYDDTGAPSDGSGRYFRIVLNAAGAAQQTSAADRGYRLATVSGITISGTIFSDDALSAPLSGSATVKMAVGADVSYTADLTGGNFNFGSVTQPGTSTVITIWLSGTTSKATLVFKFGDGCTGLPDCTGLAMVKDAISIDNKDTTGGDMTNALLAACDSDSGSECNTTDIGFTANSGSFAAASWPTSKLRIEAGTFAPGGNVTVPKLYVGAGGTYSGGSETLALTGSGASTTCADVDAMPLCAIGLFAANANTVNFTGQAATTIPRLAFRNLQISPAAGDPAYAFAETTPTTQNWYDPAWLYRKVITVDRTKIASSTGETYANFPLLINLPSDANLAASATSTGADILFTSADGTTKLNHEIETFASSTGQLIAWVNVGLAGLSTSTDTILYMYYGNSSVASSQANPAAVWDNNYKAVLHLPDGNSLSAADSTGSYTFTNTNVAAASGQIDGSGNFAWDQGIISDTTSNSFQLKNNPITFSLWAKVPASASSTGAGTCGSTGAYLVGAFPDELGNGNNSWFLENDSNSMLCFSERTWTGSLRAGVTYPMALNDNAWHYFTGTASDTAPFLNLYVDGNLATSTTSFASSQTNASLYLILNPYAFYGKKFVGVLDEFRFSDIARSADWIMTEYNNQFSPATFATTSSQTAFATGSSTILSIAGDLTIGDGSHGVTLTAPGGAYVVGNDLTISSGTLDLDINSTDLTVTGDLSITGTLNASANQPLTVAGDWTNSGNFVHNNGSVIFSGPGTASNISGATTFYNFTSTAAGKTLAFQKAVGSSPVFAFEGVVTLAGAPGNDLVIRSDTAGQQWLARFTNPQYSISRVYLTDCGCDSLSNYLDLDQTVSNGGNNGSCWFRIISHGGGGGGGGSAAVLGIIEEPGQAPAPPDPIVTGGDEGTVENPEVVAPVEEETAAPAQPDSPQTGGEEGGSAAPIE